MSRVTYGSCHWHEWHEDVTYWWILSHFNALDSFICVTWLIHMWHDSLTRMTRLMCDMTHSYVWHDSFIRVTWLIHMWHDSLTRMTRLMCDMTHSFVWRDSFICDMTHWHEWHDLCVTWLIHMCDMTHSFVWRDSFTCDMTHWHEWHDLFRRDKFSTNLSPSGRIRQVQNTTSCHNSPTGTEHDKLSQFWYDQFKFNWN